MATKVDKVEVPSKELREKLEAMQRVGVNSPYSLSAEIVIKKFDKDGAYIQKHLPELREVEPKNLHNESFLLNANILNYPRPIVEHKEAAQIAIESFKKGG
jgi:deoxyribodipyrimidine photo-lyase